MKILLTSLNSKHIHSNLAIRYLYRYCQDSFPELKVREFTINQDPDYYLGEIFKGNYQVVCFSCYIWNITQTLQLVAILKKVDPNLIIVLGGPEVSFDPQEIMRLHQAIDYIVLGEGEVTLKELLDCIKTGQGNVENIRGLAYRQGDYIKVTEARPLITDLEQIPFPYKEEDLPELKNKIIYYESSRGCPFGCSYCLSSTLKGVRFFPLERVKKDLKFFLDAKVEQVKFVDRTFNVKKSHSLEIMRFLQAHDNGHTNFHFEITADLLDDETLSFLENVRPGLFQFEIGVQTTNPDALKAIRRSGDFNKLKTVVERLASFKNIHLHLDLIAGLPYEGFESFKNSFNDVYALKPDNLQLGFLKLLKGTPIREEEHLHGYIYRDEPPYEVLANKYISFKELLRLKAMEEMLELYYNSHHFTFSLDYLVNNFYPEPADLFEDLSKYWEMQGLHHTAHNKAEQYKILLDFYQNKNLPQKEIFGEVLKLDFLCHSKSPLPPFFTRLEPEDFKNACHKFLQEEEKVAKYLPEYQGLPAKTIMKRVHFEVFSYDIVEIIAHPLTAIVNKKPTVILFDYKPDNKVLNKFHFRKVEMQI
ncbi:MAG TPA: B12-binding domain-containing radical SAM protein [Clostridia bacterium]|nr:B12-binding domain-containing radical SAM protein [Clostridia bacterium]